MTSAFENIKAGLLEAIAHADGKSPHIKVHRPRPVDVKAVRAKIGMTQEQFTSFGFSLSAIRHWEAHRRMPEGPARVLLMVIARNPSVVLETLHR